MGRKKKARPYTPWEIAKPLLEEDYLARRITDDMLPAQVRELRVEYQKVGKTFGSNLRRMQKAIRQHRSRAFIDAKAFASDKRMHTLACDDPKCWNGSDAQCSLKQDIEAGLHLTLKPKSLHLLREEYLEFTLDQFRPHIHQETRSTRETNYWIVKRKLKEDDEKARREAATKRDDDFDEMDFDFFERDDAWS